MSLRSLVLPLLAGTLTLAHAAPHAVATCGQPGQWLIPAEPAARLETTAQMLERLANQHVVLLGEIHDSLDDHRWQLEMLTALHQRHPDLAIGFEMFPRRLQGVLNQWVNGQLSEAEFLRQAEWDKVWGFNAEFYLPLFRFARQNRLPMLALNVERGLVQQVRASGWDSASALQREGVSRPAEPSPAYRTELKAVFDLHPSLMVGDASTQFAHFVEAQTLWDRAMAEGIANYRREHPATLVVGILGAGHLHNGFGVPHQLQALGGDRIANLMTLPSDQCGQLTPGLADAVYVIPPQPEAVPPQRLGVALKESSDGVMIEMVMPGSLAEQSGLKNGDVILQAAGSRMSRVEEVRGIVQRQPAGTWLPLLIKRGEASLEIVVRFPARS